MQKIIPHLWFDKAAKEAADFYVASFKEAGFIDSVILHHGTLKNTPSGDCDFLSFKLAGFEFMSIGAGPYFKPNPSISFMVNFDPSKDAQAKEHLDMLWAKLGLNGKVLMPLAEYPFSKWYGWIQDQYGFSWQLILTNPQGEVRPTILPSLMFVGDVAGKAEEATNLYLSLFENAKRGAIARYPAGMEPDKEGTIMFSDFSLAGVWFVAMDSAHKHEFQFGEAISLLVQCKDQAEIDHYWQALSAVPESEQCGWCKDKFGVSWQITPARLQEVMQTGSQEVINRVTEAFLPMKKFDLAALERAIRGGEGVVKG